MKFMGWGWPDLMATPPDVVQEVIAIMNEQVEAMERDRH